MRFSRERFFHFGWHNAHILKWHMKVEGSRGSALLSTSAIFIALIIFVYNNFPITYPGIPWYVPNFIAFLLLGQTLEQKFGYERSWGSIADVAGALIRTFNLNPQMGKCSFSGPKCIYCCRIQLAFSHNFVDLRHHAIGTILHCRIRQNRKMKRNEKTKINKTSPNYRN